MPNRETAIVTCGRNTFWIIGKSDSLLARQHHPHLADWKRGTGSRSTLIGTVSNPLITHNYADLRAEGTLDSRCKLLLTCKRVSTILTVKPTLGVFHY